MGGKTIATSDTRLEALDLQSSSYGVTVAVVYGMNKIAGNLFWYGGFAAIPTTTEQAGGKGGQTQASITFNYTADVMMGLCEGTISAIPRVWRGTSLYDGSNNNAPIAQADESFAGISVGQTVTVAHAANLTTVASVTAIIPSSGTGDSEVDAIYCQLADGVDFIRTGGAFEIVSVPNDAFSLVPNFTVEVIYSWDDSESWQNGLIELGMSFFSGEIGQAPWTLLDTQFANESVGYSGFAYVAAQDYPLGGSAQLDNHNFEIVGPMAYSIDPSFPDANPVSVTFDLLTNDRYGIGMPSSMFFDPTAWSQYCLASGIVVSPALTEQSSAAEFLALMAQITNTGPVWSGDKLKMVPYGDANLSGQGPTANLGFTFTPNNEAIFDLDDRDFTNIADPIKVTRTQTSDAYNHVTVEFINRDNLYNVEIAEVKDQASIDQYGLRTAPSLQCHWICRADVAAIVAQIVLQRYVYIRNTYEITVPWNYCQLEPMDLITLTDPDLQYDKLAVRVTKKSEAADGEITLTCEDFPLGVASMTEYTRESGNGYAANWNVSAGNVSAPVIFEMPGSLTTTGLELGIAVTGCSPNWGGCDVWVSYEGDSYVQIGTVSGGSRYGHLTSPIAGGVVGVQLEGTGVLTGVTSNSALLGTLCYIGGADQEFVAYETATLTGNETYTLGGLARGAYETVVASHNAGDPFVRVDDAIAVSAALDRSLVGTTVYIKLVSFNIFGSAKQSLADVDPYTYVVTGIFVDTKEGVRTFQQNTAPLDPNIGDLWQVPATGAMYRWTGVEWVIYSTVGANESNFEGIVGIGNLLPYSSFRDDVNADGAADGWLPLGGGSPTLTFSADGGLFGTGSQQLAWTSNANVKGIVTDTANGAGVIGGWQPGTQYMVSGYARTPSTSAELVQMLWDTPPITVEWPINPVLVDSYQRFVARITMGSTVQANGSLAFAIGTMGQGSIEFSNIQVTEGNILTEWVEAIPDIRRAASDAQTQADNAANMAQVALDSIGAAVSDNLLAPSEKRAIVIDYNAAINEQAGIDAQAIDFNVSHSAYDGATANLISYMGTLNTPTWWYDATGSTVVDGPTFKAIWVAYYGTRQTLLNAISTAAQALSTIAQNSANLAASNASTAIINANVALAAAIQAQNTANQASADANNALSAIGVAASDNTLVPSEKRAIIVDYNTIIATQPGIDASAVSYGITTEKTAFDGAVANLTSYLATQNSPTLWSNISGSTNIVGTTFVAKFQAVYTTEQTLLNKVAAVALAIANNAAATANSVSSVAAAAQALAVAALANATAANITATAVNATVANITADNVLTPVEKGPLIQDVTVIESEEPNIVAQAGAFNITGSVLTNFTAAFAALNSYLTSVPTYSNLSVNTNIDGPTMRARFATYETAKVALEMQIAAVAGTQAAWDGVIDVPPTIYKNLIDPSWWSPIATFLWNKNDNVVGETSIIYGIGPKDSIQALVRCVAAGTPGAGADGGWSETTTGPGTPAELNSFDVDPTKCYRFAVPVYVVTGNGALVYNYWGPSSLGQVSSLNTETPNTNPYFAQSNSLLIGRWYLMVGFIMPVGTTTGTNDGAGIFDLLTGIQVAPGTNFQWSVGASWCSTRAYQFYSNNGAETRFGYPFVNVVDGTEPSLTDLYSDLALLNTNQQYQDVHNKPAVLSTGGSNVAVTGNSGVGSGQNNYLNTGFWTAVNGSIGYLATFNGIAYIDLAATVTWSGSSGVFTSPTAFPTVRFAVDLNANNGFVGSEVIVQDSAAVPVSGAVATASVSRQIGGTLTIPIVAGQGYSLPLYAQHDDMTCTIASYTMTLTVEPS